LHFGGILGFFWVFSNFKFGVVDFGFLTFFLGFFIFLRNFDFFLKSRGWKKSLVALNLKN